MKISTIQMKKDLGNSFIRTEMLNMFLLKEDLCISGTENKNPFFDWSTKCNNYEKMISNGMLRDDGDLVDTRGMNTVIKHIEIKSLNKKGLETYCKIDEFNSYDDSKVFVLVCSDVKLYHLEEKGISRIIMIQKKDLLIKDTIRDLNELKKMGISRPCYRISFKNGTVIYNDVKDKSLIGAKNFLNERSYIFRKRVGKFIYNIINKDTSGEYNV